MNTSSFGGINLQQKGSGLCSLANSAEIAEAAFTHSYLIPLLAVVVSSSWAGQIPKSPSFYSLSYSHKQNWYWFNMNVNNISCWILQHWRTRCQSHLNPFIIVVETLERVDSWDNGHFPAKSSFKHGSKPRFKQSSAEVNDTQILINFSAFYDWETLSHITSNHNNHLWMILRQVLKHPWKCNPSGLRNPRSFIHSFCLKHSHVKYDCLLLLA